MGALAVVIGFSSIFVGLPDRLVALNAFVRSGLFLCRLRLVNHCRAGHADDPVLRIRASRTADSADNRSLVDQWDATARRDNVIEREYMVESHHLDTVLENLCRPPELHGRPCLVLR